MRKYPTLLEWAFCSPDSPIVRFYDYKSFSEHLIMLRKYKKNEFLNNNQATISDGREVRTGKRILRQDEYFQHQFFLRLLVNGLKTERMCIFFVKYFKDNFDIKFSKVELFGDYYGDVNWERWQQVVDCEHKLYGKNKK